MLNRTEVVTRFAQQVQDESNTFFAALIPLSATSPKDLDAAHQLIEKFDEKLTALYEVAKTAPDFHINKDEMTILLKTIADVGLPDITNNLYYDGRIGIQELLFIYMNTGANFSGMTNENNMACHEGRNDLLLAIETNFEAKIAEDEAGLDDLRVMSLAQTFFVSLAEQYVESALWHSAEEADAEYLLDTLRDLIKIIAKYPRYCDRLKQFLTEIALQSHLESYYQHKPDIDLIPFIRDITLYFGALNESILFFDDQKNVTGTHTFLHLSAISNNLPLLIAMQERYEHDDGLLSILELPCIEQRDSDILFGLANEGSALVVAAYNGADKIIKELLNYPLNINARAGNDEPALVLAAGEGHVNCVKLLLDSDALTEATGSFYQKTAQEVAEKKFAETGDTRYRDIVDMILEAKSFLGLLKRLKNLYTGSIEIAKSVKDSHPRTPLALMDSWENSMLSVYDSNLEKTGQGCTGLEIAILINLGDLNYGFNRFIARLYKDKIILLPELFNIAFQLADAKNIVMTNALMTLTQERRKQTLALVAKFIRELLHNQQVVAFKDLLLYLCFMTVLHTKTPKLLNHIFASIINSPNENLLRDLKLFLYSIIVNPQSIFESCKQLETPIAQIDKATLHGFFKSALEAGVELDNSFVAAAAYFNKIDLYTDLILSIQKRGAINTPYAVETHNQLGLATGGSGVVCAALMNSQYILGSLLKLGVSASGVAANGHSALVLATTQRHLEAVELLVKHNADLFAKNNEGKIAHQIITDIIAESQTHLEVIIRSNRTIKLPATVRKETNNSAIKTLLDAAHIKVFIKEQVKEMPITKIPTADLDSLVDQLIAEFIQADATYDVNQVAINVPKDNLAKVAPNLKKLKDLPDTITVTKEVLTTIIHFIVQQKSKKMRVSMLAFIIYEMHKPMKTPAPTDTSPSETTASNSKSTDSKNILTGETPPPPPPKPTRSSSDNTTSKNAKQVAIEEKIRQRQDKKNKKTLAAAQPTLAATPTILSSVANEAKATVEPSVDVPYVKHSPQASPTNSESKSIDTPTLSTSLQRTQSAPTLPPVGSSYIEPAFLRPAAEQPPISAAKKAWLAKVRENLLTVVRIHHAKIDAPLKKSALLLTLLSNFQLLRMYGECEAETGFDFESASNNAIRALLPHDDFSTLLGRVSATSQWIANQLSKKDTTAIVIDRKFGFGLDQKHPVNFKNTALYKKLASDFALKPADNDPTVIPKNLVEKYIPLLLKLLAMETVQDEQFIKIAAVKMLLSLCHEAQHLLVSSDDKFFDAALQDFIHACDAQAELSAEFIAALRTKAHVVTEFYDYLTIPVPNSPPHVEIEENVAAPTITIVPTPQPISYNQGESVFRMGLFYQNALLFANRRGLEKLQMDLVANAPPTLIGKHKF